jgi:3-methyladenine DNA glycosylase AlkC
MAEKFLLKDQLFNKTKVEHIAGELGRAHPPFLSKKFTQAVVRRFPDLELKERISWIAECLKAHLPAGYQAAVKIILRSLPPPNNPELSDDDFGDFIYAPYMEYVARYGCDRENLEFSLDALYQLTMRFSAEDAIRSFLNAFPAETLQTLARWSKDSHYHVRRLCSEGTRPKLPWSRKINIPVSAPLPLLDVLHADRARFVTRSVANHINDIAKIDPALVIRTLTRWKKAKRQNAAELDFIIRHALRTLIKHGDPAALKLLGANHEADVRVLEFKAPAVVKMNNALEFSCTIRAREDAYLIADYILYFQNKAGEPGGRKVFKLKALDVKAGESVTLTRKHTLRENMTTRKLYRGKHRIELQINGKVYGKKDFRIV